MCLIFLVFALFFATAKRLKPLILSCFWLLYELVFLPNPPLLDRRCWFSVSPPLNLWHPCPLTTFTSSHCPYDVKAKPLAIQHTLLASGLLAYHTDTTCKCTLTLNVRYIFCHFLFYHLLTRLVVNPWNNRVKQSFYPYKCRYRYFNYLCLK